MTEYKLYVSSKGDHFNKIALSHSITALQAYADYLDNNVIWRIYDDDNNLIEFSHIYKSSDNFYVKGKKINILTEPNSYSIN